LVERLGADHFEQQIQDQHAQDLLRAESVAANISANLRGHQVGQDLLLHLRQPVENLGNQAKLQRMLVRNLAHGKRWLNAMSRAHEISLRYRCARRRKTDHQPQPYPGRAATDLSLWAVPTDNLDEKSVVGRVCGWKLAKAPGW